MNSLFSVIIPCYNYAHFLSETLDSVLKQTYSNWECIIVNDGSTDNTEEIANYYILKDNRFKYIKQENGGLSSARNKGLSVAKGSFIQFLDADDLINPKKLEHHALIFEQQQDIDITYTDFCYFDSDTYKIIPRVHFTRQIEDDTIADVLFNLGKNGFIIPIHCAIFRKEVFDNLKFNIALKAREDWFMWLNLAIENRRFLYIGGNYALYRKHGNSMVDNNSYMAFYLIKSSMLALEVIPDIYKPKLIDQTSNWVKHNMELVNKQKKMLLSDTLYKILKPFFIIYKILKCFFHRLLKIK